MGAGDKKTLTIILVCVDLQEFWVQLREAVVAYIRVRHKSYA